MPVEAQQKNISAEDKLMRVSYVEPIANTAEFIKAHLALLVNLNTPYLILNVPNLSATGYIEDVSIPLRLLYSRF